MKLLEYTSYSTGIDLASSSTNSRLAQRFKLRHAAPVGIASLRLKKTGSPSGYLYCEIQNSSSDNPSGTAIATSDSIDMSEVSTSYSYINFTFDMDARAELTKNDSYHIVLRASSGYSYVDGTTEIIWSCDQSSPSFLNGEGETYDGGSWSNISTDTDFTFKLYSGERTDDTYFNLRGIEALTRTHTNNGRFDYGEPSKLTATHVYDFGDMVCSQIDAWLRGAGFTTPITNTTAKRMLEPYGNSCVAMNVEFAQRTALRGERGAGTPAGTFRDQCWQLRDELKDGGELVDALIALGIDRATAGQLGRGLTAGSVEDDDHDDWLDDDTIRKPVFEKEMWDNP